MLYFLLYLVFGVAFTQTIRWAQLREVDIYFTVAVNYVTAAVASLVFLCVWGDVTAVTDIRLMTLGVLNGVLYCVGLYLLLECFRIVGTGIAAALANSASIVPVLVSHVIWTEDEPMTRERWIAVALLPLAAALMRPPQSEHVAMTMKGDIVLLLAFVCVGLSMTLHKVATVSTGPGGLAAYQAYLFLTAALTGAVVVAIQRKWSNSSDWTWGVIVGLVNALTTRLTVASITALSAVIFFTTGGPLVVVLTVISGVVLWRERISRRQAIGIIAAMAIVVLSHV